MLHAVAEFHEEIRKVTPSIVECLTDPEWRVREAAINGLSNLVMHRMYYH